MDARDVLDELRDGDTVSGQELAERYEVSRNAVWKHVEKLRDEGFDVESNGDGYSLRSVPDSGGLAVAYHLDSGEIGNDLEHHDAVASTNAVAADAARDDALHGYLVVADRQTGGKGRRGREWESPEGGVWASCVLRPDLSPREASVITLAASVAVARALEDLGVDAEIKWPNDVLVDERKVCGVLVELEADSESVHHAVVGVGLNANAKPDVEDATSVAEEIGRDVDRAALTAAVFRELERLLVGPRDEVLDEWRRRSGTLGREVRIETPDEVFWGVADDIDDTGALVVDTDDGERIVSAADCEHLR